MSRLSTVDLVTSIPSIPSSPMNRGVSQSGFAPEILRMSSRAEHTEPAVQAFLTQEAHQPLALTSLPPKTVQGPLASPGLPV